MARRRLAHLLRAHAAALAGRMQGCVLFSRLVGAVHRGSVPPQPAFFEQINYYRTCLHELTHATGHAKRLGRDLANSFGTKGYAREELVAELGSAFLCAALGIVPTVRHADYIASWLEVLREDNRAIFRAASQASKAADWLLARHRDAMDAQVEGRIAA